MESAVLVAWCPTKLLHYTGLAVVHTLNTVTECGFDNTYVSDELCNTGWFYRCCLIAPPHCSVYSDVTLDQTGPQCRSHDGG